MSLVRNEERTPQQLSELLAILQAQGYGQASLGALMGEYLSLPGLVGFWSGGNRGSSSSTVNALADISGKGLHLTRNGAANFRLEGLIPCVTYDGSTAYMSHADAAIFDIDGTEGNVLSTERGLTCGAWVQFDNAPSATEAILTKWSTSNFSYNLTRISDGRIRFRVSSNGTSTTTVDSVEVTSAATWYFVAGKFEPSTRLSVFLNADKAENSTSIPASLFSGAAAFGLGARPDTPTDYLDGRIAMSFLCASLVPDATLLSLYHMGKRLFGA